MLGTPNIIPIDHNIVPIDHNIIPWVQNCSLTRSGSIDSISDICEPKGVQTHLTVKSENSSFIKTQNYNIFLDHLALI